MANEVPGACGDEPQSDDSIWIVGEEDITGYLFLNETRVRLITIQRSDDVIAIRPCVGSQFVFVVAT